MSLPANLNAGKDSIPKRIIQYPKVINCITATLTKTKNGTSLAIVNGKMGPAQI
jgi:hypothetical protein